jgi:uncharacterized membrane protein YtjA (UPF0391 family)
MVLNSMVARSLFQRLVLRLSNTDFGSKQKSPPNAGIFVCVTGKVIICSVLAIILYMSNMSYEQTEKRRIMLSWSIVFLVAALIAGILGFGGTAYTIAWIAKVLFILFLMLFLVSLIFSRPRDD